MKSILNGETGSRVTNGVISGFVSVFQPQLSHLLAVWAWAWHLTSLCLSLCIAEIDMIIVPASGLFWWVNELIEVNPSQQSLAFSDYRTLGSSSGKMSVPEFSKISVFRRWLEDKIICYGSHTLIHFRIAWESCLKIRILDLCYSRIFAIIEILDVLVSVL